MDRQNQLTDLTVTELARSSEVEPHVVRYYTRIGLLSPKRNSNNGYKLFSLGDVRRVRFIRKAKLLGYTLGEIAKIIDHASQGESPCPVVREIIEKRITENRHKLNELMALQNRMEQALEDWQDQPDKLPDGDMICHLIETAIDDLTDN